MSTFILHHTVFKVAVSSQQLSSLGALSHGPLVVHHVQSVASKVIVEKRKRTGDFQCAVMVRT